MRGKRTALAAGSALAPDPVAVAVAVKMVFGIALFGVLTANLTALRVEEQEDTVLVPFQVVNERLRRLEQATATDGNLNTATWTARREPTPNLDTGTDGSEAAGEGAR